MEQKLSIKNMVCPRCIMAVETELNNLKIKFLNIKLGEVTLAMPLEAEQKVFFKNALEALGFELLNDKNAQLIERIKNAIIDLVHSQDQLNRVGNLSEYLAKYLAHNYSSLSKLFSDVEGITIEKYMILQKIEKAKELLIYDELNVSEIAFYLNYSTSQHFSTQFKSVTGLSPSEFKKDKDVVRKPLTEL